MSKLVEQARSYIGTPFKHMGRGAALDCAGLIVRSYADLGVQLQDVEHYGRTPFRNGLMRAAREAMGDPIWTGPRGTCLRQFLKVGNIVVIAFVNAPHHFALIADDDLHGLSLIHADNTPGVQRVVASPLDAAQLARIVAVFKGDA